MFQPSQYISLDYARQDAVTFSVNAVSAGQESTNALPDIGYEALPVKKGEPLQIELASFFQSVRNRQRPLIDGWKATQVLGVAEAILAKIKEHGDLVAETVRRHT